ncbi:MAG: diguanylate cyclase [Oceanicoccus sp.]
MLAKTTPPAVRVLVVDDSRLIRVAAAKMFGNEFDVLLAEDGAKAWEIIQRDPDIQVVFTDLVMPNLDGFELLERIRTSNSETISNLPVIVATGADNPEVAKQKAIGLGATDFITKPFDASAIRTRGISYAKLHMTNKILHQQTTIDVLTGMLNSQGLAWQLEKDLAFAIRHTSTMTVMSVEIDRFKELFITIGRAGTEAIVKRLGTVLTNTVRKEDTVARTGVARFGITMPLVEANNGLELAERICRSVEKIRATLNGKRMEITASVGMCVIDDYTQGVEAVMDIANLALNSATERGRSQMYQMTTKDYQAPQDHDNLSIDALLLHLQEGQQEAILPHLDAAIARMGPLLTLLSNEQKQRVLNYRQ